MAPNRITRGQDVHRALLAGAATVLLVVGLGSCGSGGSSGASDEERDEKVLNEVLARQSAAVDAYGRALPTLAGADRAAAQQFRAQEQEHLDSTTKTLRGIGGEADPSSETIEVDDLQTRRDALEFLYAMESATIDLELNAVSKLTIDWPRPLIASMAANQAQRLVLLRRALGATRLKLIPSAFETGETPPPERTIGK